MEADIMIEQLRFFVLDLDALLRSDTSFPVQEKHIKLAQAKLIEAADHLRNIPKLR